MPNSKTIRDPKGSQVDKSVSKNFTPHLSTLNEEGRRNQPKNVSPKKVKERHSAENVAETERKKEMGVLEKFSS